MAHWEVGRGGAQCEGTGALMKIPGLDRLGVPELVRDHQDTLYWIDDLGRRRRRPADWVVLWVLPTLVVIAAFVVPLRLQSTSGLLNGTAILTGGLFTLLVMIFGLHTVGRNLHPALTRLVRETRANVAYATAWGLLLTVTLMLIDALRTSQAPDGTIIPMSPGLSALVLGMFAHLCLVLLVVLNRIRLVFRSL